jgi:tRNA 2-thiocytidine biosynthesis protein TtcA
MNHRLIESLFTGTIPPYIMRFVKQVGRGINSCRMIKPDETVLLGISGGKDSLVMALALSLRRRWIPVDYSLKAVQIDWKEYPINTDDKLELISYFKALSVPLEFIEASIFPDSFKGKFNCYLCSRNRKRILFTAMHEMGIRKLALGHHMDDIIETTLINMIYHGNFSTMMPVQEFFKGDLLLVRPMCLVKETMANNICRKLELPVFTSGCPYNHTNIREKIKPIIRDLCKLNKQARENLYRAPWNIQADYLPSRLNEAEI